MLGLGAGASVQHTSAPSDARALPARAHSPLHGYSHPARSHCTNALLAQSVLFFTPYTPLGMHLSCVHLWPACTLPPLTYTLCTCVWLLSNTLHAHPPEPLHPKPCLHTPSCAHTLLVHAFYSCTHPTCPFSLSHSTCPCNLCTPTLLPYSCVYPSHTCILPRYATYPCTQPYTNVIPACACSLTMHTPYLCMYPTCACTPPVLIPYSCMRPTCAWTLLTYASYLCMHPFHTHALSLHAPYPCSAL